MCGIAGVIDLGGKPIDLDLLHAMTETQSHRGPDDGGVWTEGPVGLGHRRLSILDLSSAGRQPMQSPDGRYIITYNGEIYNYLELRRDLQRQGVSFRTNTDTEVLLAAYARRGPQCVNDFLGMWAFAIWDRATGELFCSRDCFGIKPFFYLRKGTTVYFASDIRALLLVDDSAAPNWDFLIRQLSSRRFRRIDETSFRDIRALPPASNLRISRGTFNIERHWNYSPDDARQRYDFTNPAATFREILADAVRIQFRSDVPVGVCLSGGLDSSSIVALASRELDAQLKTFSISYPGAHWSEDRFIDDINRTFNCFPVSASPPGNSDFLDTIEAMVAAHGEPDQGIGVYSQWKVMELAREHVTVLLNGQGGDELLAGYPYFYETHLGTLIRDRQWRTALHEYRCYREFGTHDFGRQALKLGFPRFARLLRNMRGDVNRAETLSALHPDFAAASNVARDKHLRDVEMLADTGGVIDSGRTRFIDAASVARQQYETITENLLQSLLYFEDRNSMAFSLEARVPFLDRRLVEFCLALPPGQLLRDGFTKRVLREALAEDLPASIRHRRDKKGYPTPFAVWLRSGLMDSVREFLLDDVTLGRKILSRSAIETRLTDHETGKANRSVEIFNWIVLESWFRRFIDTRGHTPAASVRTRGKRATTAGH